MINVQELRIGNYIKQIDHLGNGKETKIIQVNELSFKQINFSYRPFDYEPVLLTEEWLEKLGFKFHKLLDWYREGMTVDGVTVHFSFDMWRNDEIDFDDLHNYDFVEVPLEIRYVHQLQNLYHSLMGKELTILN